MMQVVPNSFKALDWYALDRFERLVLSQQPASKPWAPVTDYSFEARKAIEGPHAELIKRTFAPTAVLDYGCGFGHLVSMLRLIGVTTKGYDPNLPSAEVRQPNTRGRCSRDRWSLNSWMPFDLVICREVLEHLTIRQIRSTVTDLCALSFRYVYVTTRFAQAPDHLLDVDTSDDLDPTHISMLNQDFLRVLFVLEGFKRRADLEQQMDWKQLGRVLVYERAA